MYDNTMNAIVQEVIRLLNQQRNLLKSMLEQEELLKDEQSQERSVDVALAEQWIETLEDEITKVDGLEMTLAVVGTMKAGKSTTINAIVGQEVLPNRNRPMTTLPTIIRHKVGQTTPTIMLPKLEPFNRALSALRAAMERLPEDEINQLSFASTEDGKSLIQEILSGDLKELEANYSGAEGIYLFLKVLNDISRLCNEEILNVTSPILEYSSITEFPVIEVEFHHLKGKEQQLQGSLALIDTPGPNEAGQGHLKKILQEQLQKASAVLSVLDYTQLNSEADAAVRQEIDYISSFSKDRLYVLVNKFDQKDRNSMDASEVQQYVGKELFEEEIPSGRIFPVSSQFGYLANYALHELDSTGNLPTPEEAKWVEDFGQRALGVDWEEDIEDADLARRGAQKLWKKSNFSEPLEQVISESYSKAAFVSLSSAVDKMLHYDNEVIDYLKIRSGSITIDINELKKLILELEQDIERIAQASRRADDLSSKTLGKLTSMTDDLFSDGERTIKHVIEQLFDHGKRLEDARNQAETEGRRKRSVFDTFKSFLNVPRKDFIILETNGPNVFSSKEEAEYFIAKINKVLEKDISVISMEIQSRVTQIIHILESDINKEVQMNVSNILEHAADILNEFFDLNLSFESHKIKPIKVDFDQLGNKFMEEKTVEKTRISYERKWYTLWLKEHAVSYKVSEQEYHVDTKEIGKQAVKELKKAHQQLHNDLNSYVTKELGDNVKLYFDGLKQYLDKYRGNILDGLSDKQAGEEVLGKLLVAMEQYLSVAENHIEDVTPVHLELKQINNPAREVVQA
ncbi:dynamin family protein [Paenibacillus sp. FSL R7-0272]|uniref:dynamin family protein n=1 Tax=Paenibacillus sp. FSL R7-0272 TaxID=2921679 RepID=UPI0030D9AEF9